MDDFLGIGLWEVLLIMIVAVILVGPAKMVELGRTLGKITGNLKKASFDLTSQLTKELEEEKKAQPPKPTHQD